MKKRITNKSNGFTLIEVLVYISILSILFFSVTKSLERTKEQQEFSIHKRSISQFIRKIQQYSQYNKKEYILDFKISENKAYFKDFVNGKEEIIGKIELSKNISYMTNNKKKNEDFTRSTTVDGNFEKGFSIYLMNKKGDKIYYRVSTNTINSAKYPIISIYRAKHPIGINEDYQKAKFWIEEL